MADIFTRIVLRAKDEASGILDNVWGKIKLFLGVTLFAGWVKQSADFEKAMDAVIAKTDDGTSHVEELEQAALRMGAQAQGGAVEAAQGLEILGAAGLKATDAIKTLPAVLALAKAENLALADAAGIVTDSLSILGLGYDQAARAADVLVKAANLSNTTAAEVAAGLKTAGGEARNAGLSIEQFAGTMDQLAQNGLRGAEAGTALRNILALLGDPAGAARRELAALGDTSGTLSGAIDAIGAAGKRGEAAIRAFGVESGPALRALLAGGNESIAQYTKQLEAAAGAAGATANTLETNLIGAFSSFLTTLNTLAIQTAKPLLEPLTNGFKVLTEVVAEFAAKYMPQFQQAFRNGIDAVTTDTSTFRDTLRTAFEKAAQFVKGFADNFSFENIKSEVNSAITAVSNFVTQLRDILPKAVDAGRTAADTFTVAWNGAFSVVNAALSGVQTLVSGVLGAVSAAVLAAKEVGLASQETYAKLREEAAKWDRAAEDSAGRSMSAWDRVREAMERLKKTTEDTGKSQEETSRVAQEAAERSRIAAEEREAAEIRAANAAKLAAAAQEEAAYKVAKAQEEQRNKSEELTKRTLELQQEYQKFLDMGDTANAARVLVEINALLRESSNNAKAAGGDISAAFTVLKVDSAAALANLAAEAVRAFEIIRSSGTATPREIEDAFVKMAQARLKAAEQVSEKEEAATKAMLSQEVAALGLSEVFNKLIGKQGELAASKGSTNVQIEDQTRLMNALNAAQEAGVDVTGLHVEQIENETNKAKEAAAAQKEHAAAVKDVKDTMRAAGNEILGVINYMYSLSNAAGNALLQIKKDTEAVSDAAVRLQGSLDLARAQESWNKFIAGTSGTMPVLDAFYNRASQIKTAFYEQALAAEQLRVRLEEATSTGSIKMFELDSATKAAASSFNLLDAEQLDGLRAAISAAKAQVDGLRDSVGDTLATLRDEFDRLNGNMEAIEQRSYEKQRAELEALMEATSDAATLGDLRESLRLLDEIHAAKMRDLRDDGQIGDQYTRTKENVRGLRKEIEDLSQVDISPVKKQFESISQVFDTVNREALLLSGQVQQVTKRIDDFKRVIQ